MSLIKITHRIHRLHLHSHGRYLYSSLYIIQVFCSSINKKNYRRCICTIKICWPKLSKNILELMKYCKSQFGRTILELMKCCCYPQFGRNKISFAKEKHIYYIHLYIWEKINTFGRLLQKIFFIRKKLLSANAAITKQRKQQYPPQICNIVSTHLYSVYPTVITVHQKTKYIFLTCIACKENCNLPFSTKR